MKENRAHYIEEKARKMVDFPCFFAYFMWESTFGTPITAITHTSVLEQQHYDGDWDVLRPAASVDELNVITPVELIALMREAETIMKGWGEPDGTDDSAA